MVCRVNTLKISLKTPKNRGFFRCRVTTNYTTLASNKHIFSIQNHFLSAFSQRLDLNEGVAGFTRVIFRIF